MSIFNKEKISPYFDALADTWDEICYHDSAVLREIVADINLTSSDTVLDVATGTGVLLPYLYRKTKKITALDISKKMIAKAKENYPNIRATYINADFLEFRALNNFDVVTLYGSYQCFENKSVLVKSINSVLLPGGRFIIAHSQSLDKINELYSKEAFQIICTEMNEALDEAKNFERYFKIEKIIDNESRYIILGTKREKEL